MKSLILKKSAIAVIAMTILAIVILPVLTGCGQIKDYADPITENILAGINSRDYATFSRDFDDRMKQELPEEALTTFLLLLMKVTELIKKAL